MFIVGGNSQAIQRYSTVLQSGRSEDRRSRCKSPKERGTIKISEVKNPEGLVLEETRVFHGTRVQPLSHMLHRRV